MRDRLTPDQLRQLLQSESVFATTLLVLAVDALGFACLNWEHPQTLREEFAAAYKSQLPPRNFDKLMAARAILTSDGFFETASRFVPIANALTGSGFDLGQFDPADSLECAWAVTEAMLLRPPSDEQPEPFSVEVRTYIGEVLKDEGYVYPPDVLRIAVGADFRDRVQYDFADDPAMFSAVHAAQSGKTEEVESLLRTTLAALIDQLASLPLRNGSTEALTSSAFRLIPRENSHG